MMNEFQTAAVQAATSADGTPLSTLPDPVLIALGRKLAEYLAAYKQDVIEDNEAAERGRPSIYESFGMAEAFFELLNEAADIADVDVDPRASADDDEDDGYPPPCSNPGGHEWPNVEEHEASRCVHCGADGDA